MRKLNDSAQWQMIEVIIVAGLLFAAMYFVRSANVTIYKITEEENPIQTQGYDALEALASQSSPVSGYHSLLAYCLEDTNSLNDNITSFFSYDVNFKIDLIDMTELKNNQTRTLAECTTTLITPLYWIDEGSCIATRIVNHNDNVYKVVLSLWYNLGG